MSHTDDPSQSLREWETSILVCSRHIHSGVRTTDFPLLPITPVLTQTFCIFFILKSIAKQDNFQSKLPTLWRLPA